MFVYHTLNHLVGSSPLLSTAPSVLHHNAVGPMPVAHGLPAGRVVGDGGDVALRGEVDVATRPRIIEAVDAATVVFEQVADFVVGIVGGLRFGHGTL